LLLTVGLRDDDGITGASKQGEGEERGSGVHDRDSARRKASSHEIGFVGVLHPLLFGAALVAANLAHDRPRYLETSTFGLCHHVSVVRWTGGRSAATKCG
jgi:hypothetical protein